MLDDASPSMTPQGSEPPTAPLKFVILSLDRHVASAVDRIRPMLEAEAPGLDLRLHAAAEWGSDPDAVARAKADVETGDIILANMLFMDDHLRTIVPALEARRDHCDAMIGFLAAGDVIKLTKLGRLDMSRPQRGPLALLKRLRGAGRKNQSGSSGAGQMAMLKRLPKILKYIPGKAQDLRSYFLTMQYWLSGSEENLANLVRFLVSRYADGPRRALREATEAASPADYPEIGVYHPSWGSTPSERLSDRLDGLPTSADGEKGTVGLLLMRSYLLAGDAAHYDGVIEALEARGLSVIPAFASGLDGRPAIDRFFKDENGRATVDAVVSLTGFSLVGGPAYNDAGAAEQALDSLGAPYLAAHALEFQSLDDWRAGERGLTPIEATMMVAIPEIDGAIAPMVFGGRNEAAEGPPSMRPDPERVDRLAARVEKLVRLRRKTQSARKIGIVLFNFPPNAGATGTAAFLDVFASLWNTLKALKDDGYAVELPADVDALRHRILEGDGDAAAARYGADAAVAAIVSADEHVRREPYLAEIEAQWGPAPGRHQSDGRGVFVLGAELGDVFVGVQPAFGYEGDPMRLLFEKGSAPTHAFSAFYRWLREDFDADAVLHFGTHGALEFMPGKQTGLGDQCWPERLIGDLPNFYLYAANNPSEGAIAKRRAAATLISHQTPALAQAGLYKGLVDLKSAIDRWRISAPEATDERSRLAEMIQAQAATLDLADAEPAWTAPDREIPALAEKVLEVEYALIPHGLHVVGRPASIEARAETLQAIADAMTAEADPSDRPSDDALYALAADVDVGKALDASGESRQSGVRRRLEALAPTAAALAEDSETPAILAALDGRFIRPAPGGDLVRTPDVLPTGRNIHGFDPFRIPSAFAVADGARQADRLLTRHREESGKTPETVAMVLWGTDNLKTEGGPIGQALALMGAAPRFDGYGRLCGARLLPLDTLDRPRIDVVATLSGIFRDLLPLQTRLLAEAAYLAAVADEPVERNFIRKHALAYAERCGCDLETASLRVFSNADGAYGANVNHLIDSGAWADEDELGDAYAKRKCFAYGREGAPERRPELLNAALADVDLAYQNLDSVELGVTTIDHYFDTLGGVSRAVRKAKRENGVATPEATAVYIGDQTRGAGKVRTLSEQVALETRTRTLNPKWYEGMLEHGYEGVRQIEAHVTNTMGWSATTGHVAPWIYQQITQTFVLDDEMRERLAALNPKASARVAERLLEAHERQYWRPDEETLAALRRAGDELEDRLEGVSSSKTAVGVAAE